MQFVKFKSRTENWLIHKRKLKRGGKIFQGFIRPLSGKLVRDINGRAEVAADF